MCLGGHIKPDCCRGFDEYAEYHGVETALKQCHLEAANLEALIEFIREKGLEEEVDLVTCDTVDTYMAEASWEWGFRSYENFKNAGGNVSKIKTYCGDEAKKVLRALDTIPFSLLSQKSNSMLRHQRLKVGLTSKSCNIRLPLDDPQLWNCGL